MVQQIYLGADWGRIVNGFNEEKSIAGSLAFFTASTMCSIVLAWWFRFTDIFTLPSPLLSIAVNFALVNFICAAIELAPF